MTREEWAPMVAFLSASIGKPMERAQAEVYFDLLADLPVEVVKLAVRRAVAENRYPVIPPVGTIRAHAVEATRPLAPAWSEAWTLALRAVARFGLDRKREALASLPACVRATVEAIGYRALCDAPESGLEPLRAQFRDAYNATSERSERDLRLPASLRAELTRLTDGLGAIPGLTHREDEER